MRDPTTGIPLPYATPRSDKRARMRASQWAGEFPDETEIDLYLVTSRNAHNAVREVQERVARHGVTVTAELQAMTRFPVDRPLGAQYAVLPRDERDVRDFHGRPLMYVDARPFRPLLVLVGNARHHVEALKERADEMRHYGTDIPPMGARYDVNAGLAEARERWEAARNGRRQFAVSNTDAVDGGWLEKV